MKKGLLLLGLLVGLGILFVAGDRVAKQTKPLKNEAAIFSSLTLTEDSFDFGTISMGKGNVSHTFPLNNEGTTPVTIRRITTSCMCTNAFLVNGESRKGPFGMPGHGLVPAVDDVIEPKGNRGIEVIFDPAAHGPAGVGKIERAVFIEDRNGGTKTITIRAFVTP